MNTNLLVNGNGSIATLLGMFDDPILNQTLQEALLRTQGYLQAFASTPDFTFKIQGVFGDSFSQETALSLKREWEKGELGSLVSAIELRPSSTINGVNGAYASGTSTIYLADEFLRQYQAQPEIIARVLLEEIGQAVDARLNLADSSGTEGESFADSVLGESLTSEQLAVLKVEDNSDTTTVDNSQTVNITPNNDIATQAINLSVNSNYPVDTGENAKLNYSENNLPIDPKTGVAYKPNELLVKLPVGESDVQLLDFADDYGAISVEWLVPPQTSMGSALAQWRIVKFAPDADLPSVCNVWNQSGCFEGVELNYQLSPCWTPNDKGFVFQWALNNTGQLEGKFDADIDAVEAWDIQKGSESVVVAVIDTGVDYNHEDLAANMWKNPDEIAGNGIDDDNNLYVDDVYGYNFANSNSDPMDDDGHGTAVAGIIGAVGDNNLGVIGVSPNVSIMALKNSLSILNIVEAIAYAVDNGAKVINASYGDYIYSQYEYEAISSANAKGILFVASAGNDRNNNDWYPHYPSDYNLDNIISVAATDINDELYYWSNYGANTVDLAAPGVEILTTVRNKKYGTSYEDKDGNKIQIIGTSFAAPHVSGAAALLLAQNPDLTVTQLKQRLTNTDLLPSLQNKTVTGGRLNLYKVLANIPNVTIEAPFDTVGEFGSQTFDLIRTGTTDTPLTVNYTIGGTADNGNDYQSLSGSVTFAAGYDRAWVYLFPKEDSIYEGPETVTLTLTDGANYDLGNPKSATITITDEEDFPQVSIYANGPTTIREPDGSVTLSLIRRGDTSKSLTVTYKIDGIAKNGEDYQWLSGTVNFAPDVSYLEITIDPIDDLHYEGSERVILTLMDGVSYKLDPYDNKATITITDEEDFPTFSIQASDSQAGEPNNKGVFTITRTGDPDPLTLNYTVSGTAKEGEDYKNLTNKSIYFAYGVNTVTVEIEPINDYLRELKDETVILSLNPSPYNQYKLGNSSATVTIADDDVAPVTIEASDANAGEPNNIGVFTLTRSGDTTDPLIVNYLVSGTATKADYDNLSGTVTFAAGNPTATIEINPIDDPFFEGDIGKTVTITLDPIDSKIPPSQQTATVTIADDEQLILEWIEQLGTPNGEISRGVVTDSDGNVYLTGDTGGSLGGTNAGEADAWVAKYTSSGEPLWTRQFGTADSDSSEAIATDSQGNIYLTGSTEGNLDGTNAGDWDAWVAKYDSSGQEIWKHQFGTSLTDDSSDIATDSQGNVYLTGSTGLYGTNPDDWDGWVVKYNSSGQEIWKRQFVTASDDYSTGVATDSQGNIYLTGFTYGNLAGANAGSGDAWVAKYNSSGQEIWKRQFGTADQDSSTGVATDSQGNVYLSGRIWDIGYNSDVFIAKYSPDGTLRWQERLDLESLDESYGIATDSQGNVYLTGETRYRDSSSNWNWHRDAWVAIYNSSGTLFWQDRLATPDGETSSFDVALDSSNNLYLTGFTRGSLGGTNAGITTDAWVAKYLVSDLSMPIVSIEASDGNAGESGNLGIFTLTRTGDVANSLTVHYQVSGTATNETDYNKLSGTVTFAAGNPTATIEINPIDDALGERAETVILTLRPSPSSEYVTGSPKSATVTIADNDLPIITIEASDANTGEPSDAGVFTLSRTLDTANPLTVNYTISGTATNGTDYNNLTGTVTFAAGSPTATIEINPIDDFLPEGKETVTLTLSPSSNIQYELGNPSSATVTLADNELEWLEQLGSSASDESKGIVTDSQGNVYLTGGTQGSLGGTNAGDWDAWVAKYSSSGEQIWKAQLGTSAADYSHAVTTDSEGNVYLTGYTTGDLDGSNAGDRDAWFAKYSSSGQLLWKAQLGTADDEESNGIVTDSQGNVYLTGYTYGSLGGTNAGDRDAWFAKYSSSGELLWKTQFGTATWDSSTGIAIDSQGNVYLTGETSGSLGGTYAGGGGAWVAKYSSSGEQIWKTKLGTSASDGSNGIATDSQGNVYLTGSTEGNLGGTNAGSMDVWTAKYSSSGELLWTTQLGTTAWDSSTGVATNSQGNVYVTGLTQGSLGGINAGSPNSSDAWVAEYSSSGELLWKSQLGTPSGDYSNGVATDLQDNIYLTGDTLGSLGGTNAGVDDAWIAKYSLPPTVTLSASDANAQEPSDVGVFTLSRSGDRTNPLTVYYTVSGTATNGIDYDNLSGTITFAAGASTTTIEINPIDDSLSEENETVILSLSVSPNSQYALASPNSATVTLTDNDLPIVSIEASDSDAAEPSDLGVFTLSRTSNLANPLTVYYTVGGTATNGTDYNNLSGTVTFAAGASTATIDVSPIDDLLLEGGETVTLTLNPSPDSQYIIGDLNNATVVLADNELEWLKQLGTSFRDKSNGIATDSNSNVYITGSTWGSLGGNNAGGYDYDAWTAKYSSSGELLWKAQLGTSTYDGSNGVATDSDGNVYLTGDTGGSLGGTNAGSYDAWVAKYSSSGQLLWKAQLGTSAYDGSNGVATDNLGNVYLTGDTCGSLGGTNPNTGTDTWVAKYSSSGELLWKAQLGTLYQDSSSGVATDSDGNVYLTGSTFWSLGGIWVAKYSSSGGLLWKAQLGNSSSVEGNGIATDSQGNVYLTGRTVVAKYNSSGELLWQAQLETANNSTSSSIATDSDGNVYLTGYTTGSLQGTNAGSYDAWFAKYSSSGELLWKAQLGTANDDFSNGIATDSQGNVYLTGDTQGSLGGINVGDQDAWVAKYLGSGSDLPTVTIDASDANAAEPNDVGVFTLTRSGDPDNPLTVNYTISGTATNETDYDKLTGTVTFAAGASTATIEIKPLDDSVFEGNETVILTLSPESGYSLGDSASATVTLADDEQPTSFAINSTGDAGDANPGDGFALTADGVTTLRAAIEEANASAGTQTIVFNIPTTDPGYNPTTGAFTIKPLSALPIISDAVVIDGTTQPGFSTKPIIELDGSSAGNSNGLIISAGDSTVRGLVVNRFAGNGIVLNTKGNNIIEGNYIGTDVTGTLDYGNNGSGIRAETSNNRIGGTQTGSRNIISGSNIGDGILIVGGGGNQIFGNYIGTDFTGAIALGNTNGVVIDNAPNTIIGGTEVGAGNVISGNNSNGVAIIFEGSTGTSILGNYIGTNASGTASLANQANGISVGSNANDIIIGGTETGAGNLISGNNLSGVSITGLTSQGNSHGNSILGNSIFGNGGLGIDLANGIFQGDGVTPNDLGDGDTGANNLQNYPLLTSAVSIGDNTDILGTFNSNPNNTFRLEFFANNALDPSGYGEGQTFLGVNDVTTDASGNAVINITLSTTVPLGQYITATATDLAGNTSEFSAGIIVLNPVNGTANSETVTGTSGDDYINAGAGNDTANGGEGNDVLDGGTGSDRLYGGEGNDTYIVDNSRDVVVESGGQGEDTVKSSVNHNLTANVEDLILTGTANISGTGNDLDNTIMGNSGNNLLKGLGGNDILLGEAGNDTLVGGSGNDILTGGDGSDQFLFGSGAAFATSAFGVDTLADFIRGSDKICLSKTSFNALSTAVNTNLQAGEFAAIDTTLANEVTLAGSSSARIVYNLSTGNLFYNQNGATDGLGNGALFATLTGTPLLDASDFLVQA